MVPPHVTGEDTAYKNRSRTWSVAARFPAHSMSAPRASAMSANPQGGSMPAYDRNDREQDTVSREKRRIKELEEEVEQLRSSKEARRS